MGGAEQSRGGGLKAVALRGRSLLCSPRIPRAERAGDWPPRTVVSGCVLACGLPTGAFFSLTRKRGTDKRQGFAHNPAVLSQKR